MALGGLLCANFPAKKQIVAAIKSCHGPAMTARRPITAIVKGTPICALYGEVERRPRREGAGKEREAESREALRLPGKQALSSGMEGKKPLGISKETIKEWGKTDFLLTYLRGEINKLCEGIRMLHFCGRVQLLFFYYHIQGKFLLTFFTFNSS